MLRRGLPIGVTNLAELGMLTAPTLVIGTLGVVAVAAHGIVIRITSLALVAHIGLARPKSGIDVSTP
ncbi:MATE family efflux transporter [uncultured Tateyamaria sp.]|uniref:MATE family efflux transporter n=1 Tax=uncultured Tateyamaria sp. TaxID=455651 RepID=UPI00261D67AD|nr:MATE family efflux transporter [uncultured Tateyamaria sp.]